MCSDIGTSQIVLGMIIITSDKVIFPKGDNHVKLLREFNID